MRMKKTAIASAIALTLASSSLWAATSTVGGEFIFDRDEIEPGGIVNISLLGLNAFGEVDLFGEQDGSTIVGVVESELCEVVNGTTSPTGVDETSSSDGDTTDSGSSGQFAASLKYIELNQGKARVHLRCPDDATGSDTIKVRLVERTFSQSGAVSLTPITSTQEKQITFKEPPSNPIGLHVMAFYPNASDPHGKTDCILPTDECSDIDDGILGDMTAGQSGGEIVIWADNMEAGGEITVTLKLKDVSEEEQAQYTYTYTTQMVKGTASITLDNQLTKAGKYYIEATMADFEGSSVQLAFPDIVNVMSTGVPVSLKLDSDKERIAFPDFTQVSFANDQITQGTEIRVQLLDEFGNPTSHCLPQRDETTEMNYCTRTSPIYAKIADSNNVVSNDALKLYIPANDPDGESIAQVGTDAILGNQANEIFTTGTASLVATPVDAVGTPSTLMSGGSDPLEIQVVSSGLTAQISPEFDMIDQRAGEEFNAFIEVGVINNKGQLHVDQNNPTMPINPGFLEVINTYTEEQQEFVVDSERKVQGRFLQQTLGHNKYLISDKEGRYGQLTVEAGAIVNAAVVEAEFQNAHGQVLTDIPTSTLTADYTYYTFIPEIGLKQIDEYGNVLTPNEQPASPIQFGEMRVESSNGGVLYNTPEGTHGVPSRFQMLGDFPTLAAVMYEATDKNPELKQFAGQDAITVIFTKPGLEQKPLRLTTIIPAYSGVTDIKSYIVDNNPDDSDVVIPVNSEAPLEVEVVDSEGNLFIDPNPEAQTNVTMTIDGDVIPVVKEIKWTEKVLTEADCAVIGGSFANNECIHAAPLTEQQCEAISGIVMDDSCMQVTETTIRSGDTLDFSETLSRKVFVVKAGANEGQFTLSFTPEGATEPLETRTIMVGKSEVQCIPGSTDEETICRNEDRCIQNNGIWREENDGTEICSDAPELDPASTKNPYYPFKDKNQENLLENHATFVGGVYNLEDGEDASYKQEDEIELGDNVEVDFLIRVDDRDIGKPGEVGLTAFHMSLEDYPIPPEQGYAWYMVVDCAIAFQLNEQTSRCLDSTAGWDIMRWPHDTGDGMPILTELLPLKQLAALPQYIPLYDTFHGNFTSAGDLWVYAGYIVKTPDGKNVERIVYNGEPIKIKINKKAR